MSTENVNLDDEQVRPADVQALKGYTRTDIVEPEYQALLDKMNTVFKDVPHYLQSTVEFVDPAIVILTINHMNGKCRLGHEVHQMEACLRAQLDRWYKRLDDIAQQNKLEMPSHDLVATEEEIAIPVLVRRAETLIQAYEKGEFDREVAAQIKRETQALSADSEAE
jgi:hypothetical protein